MRISRRPFLPFSKLGILIPIALGSVIFEFSGDVSAQIIPDETLGPERSRLTPVDAAIDRIDGGARRGANLFHSFQDFNIGEGRAAYFANPDGVENILSRVTGSNPSNILGTLGVLGNANLFFLNPNGILFGPNARLDIRGSFVASTANTIQFGDHGFFGATSPEVPSHLLTINPSTFFFNQLATQPNGTIENQGVLSVPDGESLLLLGGNVTVEEGQLTALGGRVGIGSVAGTGTISLHIDGIFALPLEVQRGDVVFTDAARVNVGTSDGGGTISVIARTITLTGESILLAGILPEGSQGSQAGMTWI